jgi:hypothetical protein
MKGTRMKLSQFNQLLRTIKAQYGDIEISVDGKVIDVIGVKETTAGNLACILFFNTRPHKIIATGTMLKAQIFSPTPIIPNS